MAFEDLLLNLSAEEREGALSWFDRLVRSEKTRVEYAVDKINNTEFDLHGYDHDAQYNQVALIVAGSSIDAHEYLDIDMFVLARNNLAASYRGPEHDPDRTDPGTRFTTKFGDDVDSDENNPGYVYVVDYTDANSSLTHSTKSKLFEEAEGAIITISLLHYCEGFSKRREGKLDDLIEPSEIIKGGKHISDRIVPFELGAEELIAHNREKGSKFLVLTRQYNPFG